MLGIFKTTHQINFYKKTKKKTQAIHIPILITGEEQTTTYLDKLPTEICLKIMAGLNRNALCSLRATCKRLKVIIDYYYYEKINVRYMLNSIFKRNSQEIRLKDKIIEFLNLQVPKTQYELEYFLAMCNIFRIKKLAKAMIKCKYTIDYSITKVDYKNLKRALTNAKSQLLSEIYKTYLRATKKQQKLKITKIEMAMLDYTTYISKIYYENLFGSTLIL